MRLVFEHPLDFVLGDFHDGLYIRTATNEARRAVLGAFIDHCSRFVRATHEGQNPAAECTVHATP